MFSLTKREVGKNKFRSEALTSLFGYTDDTKKKSRQKKNQDNTTSHTHKKAKENFNEVGIRKVNAKEKTMEKNSLFDTQKQDEMTRS